MLDVEREETSMIYVVESLRFVRIHPHEAEEMVHDVHYVGRDRERAIREYSVLPEGFGFITDILGRPLEGAVS